MSSGTVRWRDGQFYFIPLVKDAEGNLEDGPAQPWRRPSGWISESSEKRILSLIKRKGYQMDPNGSPQFWTGGIGMTIYLIPIGGDVKTMPLTDFKWTYGDTLDELLRNIKRLPDAV